MCLKISQGDIFKHIFDKIIINFCDMRTICPKIFAKLEFFCHNVSNGCCIFCNENILSISDIFSTLPCLPSS